MKTLRSRLILSHLLPMLLVTPLMGVALVILLETQVLLQNFASDLKSQALLLAHLTADRPRVWFQAGDAQFFITRFSPYLSGRAMLLDADGLLLASSDSGDQSRLGQPVEVWEMGEVRAGEVTVHTDYIQRVSNEVIDVFVPVVGPSGGLVGIVRLTEDLAGVYERFVRLRWFTFSILAAGLVLGAVAGWVLALSLGRLIQQVTRAVSQIAHGERLEVLPVQGPAELQRLAAEVNSLVERLRSLEASRKQLLANLVHELGRPLGALRSAIQALQGGADQDEVLRQDLLTGMDEEVGRLQRLLEDLARLHDQLLGSLDLHRRPTPLGEWLPRVLAPWREAGQEKKLHWQVDLPPGLPAVEIDADRLGQALGNLLSNAIKYTPAGGTVSVSAGVDGQRAKPEAWIRVSDSGPGIQPDELEKIFLPFYRGKQGGRFPQGMGLGLSIARDLVAAHGGRLVVQSEPGKGSVFVVSVPFD
jgi:signal transduction histidine kinase